LTGRKRSATNGGDGDENGSPEPVKKTRKAKPYIPQLRSGPYAIIKALSSLNEGASLTKAHLIDQAQQYCDSSFTVPTNPTKFHTAWNSMKTLIDKDLVDERGRPTRKYSLTDEGWKVARGINLSESGGSGNAVLDLGTRDEDEVI
jgi:crossover junction endonuclease MUS81